MSASTDGNEEATVLIITCDCGVVVRGDIEVELISNVRNHIDEAHPQRAGMASDEEILSFAKRQPLS
jgi:predicted small metal-binding protein